MTDQRVHQFIGLAEQCLKMRDDASFQAKIARKDQPAIKDLIAKNIQMNRIRQQLRNIGYEIPLTNNLSLMDIAELKEKYFKESATIIFVG